LLYTCERLNLMSKMNENDIILHDSYGSYTPSPPSPPVPPFPCTINNCCTSNNRICDQHKYILFVQDVNTKEVFEIPYGHWENWL